MIGTANCTYETPCGWCSKWDKKCDNEISDPSTKPYDYLMKTPMNKICESESDHQWECCGMSTAGFDYRCKICGTYKTEPIKSQESITISTYFNNKESTK